MTGPPDESGRNQPASNLTADLIPLVYDRLRGLARGYLEREGGFQSLQPTELVHETYIRLSDVDRMRWAGRTHFFAFAATQMRRILVERARAAQAQKRGSRPKRFTLHDNIAISRDRTLDVLAVDEALLRLAERSPRQSRVAECRLFAGLLVDETADVLGVSPKTVKRDWRMARAWLARALGTTRG